MLNVFASLKQKVIWKYESELKVPPNVMISNWIPQNDIFAHPNIKLFITHGGMLGTLEALYYSIPVLGIPFWGDQERNMECYTTTGWALSMSYNNLTDESFGWAINEILSNPMWETVKQLYIKLFN